MICLEEERDRKINDIHTQLFTANRIANTLRQSNTASLCERGRSLRVTVHLLFPVRSDDLHTIASIQKNTEIDVTG